MNVKLYQIIIIHSHYWFCCIRKCRNLHKAGLSFFFHPLFLFEVYIWILSCDNYLKTIWSGYSVRSKSIANSLKLFNTTNYVNCFSEFQFYTSFFKYWSIIALLKQYHSPPKTVWSGHCILAIMNFINVIDWRKCAWIDVGESLVDLYTFW